MEDENKNSIVLYETTFKICNSMPHGDELLMAICRKMFNNEDPTFTEDWLLPIYEQQLFLINKAKERHKKAINNGKLGGRPKNDTKNEPKVNKDYSF